MACRPRRRARPRGRGQVATAALALLLSVGWAGPATAAAPVLPVTVWLTDYAHGTMVPVDAQTGRAGRPVPVGAPDDLTFTPDGRTALVGSLDLAVTPVDTVARTAGAAIGPTFSYGPLAASADGAHVYEADVSGSGTALTRIDLATRRVVDLGFPESATDIALTPGGRTLFASVYLGGTRSGLLPFETATGRVGPLIPVAGASSLSVAPDGRTLYTAAAAGVVPVDLASRQPGRALPVPAVRDLEVDADGRLLWCATAGGLVSVDLRTRAVSRPVPDTEEAAEVHVTPGGGQVFVRLGDRVAPVDVASRSVGPALVATDLMHFGISPAQAPTASFAVDTDRRFATPVRFDASASSAGTGRVVRYQWDFGDGTRVSTSGPRTSHQYRALGSYRILLTLTNSAGVSTQRVFTAHQVLRNGGPSAFAATDLYLY